MEPVTIAMQVNIKPIGAILFVINFKFLILKIKFKIDRMAIQLKEARLIRPLEHARTLFLHYRLADNQGEKKLMQTTEQLIVKQKILN